MSALSQPVNENVYVINPTTEYAWNPKFIRHAVLTIDGRAAAVAREGPKDPTTNATLPISALVCTASFSDYTPPTDFSAMCRFAVDIANGTSTAQPTASSTVDPASFDIPVYDQCWLVIELDGDINWRFAPVNATLEAEIANPSLNVACTQKHNDRGPRRYDNFSLQHVCLQESGKYACSATISKGDDCRVIFFGVAYRRGSDPNQSPNPGSFSINLCVELYQDVDKTTQTPTRTIRLTIDPDVPNDGSNQFPNPP